MSGTAVAAGAGDHTVQFYERDEALIERVADFLAAGFAAGQPLIAILTARHRGALTDRLAELGLSDLEIHGGRQLLLLDARDVPGGLTVDGMPDEQRFTTVVAAVIERFMDGHGGASARVFGELVDLLWMDGNPDGAIRLERLWNELAGRLDFALLCAYSMDRFADSSRADRFLDVCNQHGHVLPTERYTQASDAEQLLQISMLQQRARALETELERRAELDARLRVALDARDQSLDYAQLGSGTLDYTISDVPLHEVLRAADALVLPQMRERRLAYATALPDESIVVRTDRGRLLQIIRSLLTNAARFTEPGGRVEVRCETEGAMVLVHVSDTGPGIPPSRHEEVFEAFVQGEPSFTRVRGGVGLVLAVSRQLARGMGGELRLESEVGAGSVFTLVVPRAPTLDVRCAARGDVTATRA
ncbi:MAG: sensor histidine kinase [Gemmatimonadaceae bacterium]